MYCMHTVKQEYMWSFMSVCMHVMYGVPYVCEGHSCIVYCGFSLSQYVLVFQASFLLILGCWQCGMQYNCLSCACYTGVQLTKVSPCYFHPLLFHSFLRNCWCFPGFGEIDVCPMWRNNVQVLFLFRACPRLLCRLMFTVGWDACNVESKAAAKAELFVSGDGVVAVVWDGLAELVFWLVLCLVKACNRRLSRLTERLDVLCDAVTTRLLLFCCCCFLSKEFRA